MACAADSEKTRGQTIAERYSTGWRVNMGSWILLGVATVVMMYLFYVIVHPEKF